MVKFLWAAAFSAAALYPERGHADSLPIFGRIVASTETVVSFPRAGILSDLFASPTDFVHKGQVIAHLRCDTEQAQTTAARSAAAVQELQYRSQEQLLEFSSTMQLEVAHSKAQWQRALGDVKIYEAQVEQCRLISPFDGVVSDVFVNNYAFVSAGDPILRLIDPSAKYFEFMAPIEFLAPDPTDQLVEISVTDFGVTVRGRIDRVYPEVEPVSQTVRMRAELVDPHESIRVGLPGVVSFGSE